MPPIRTTVYLDQNARNQLGWIKTNSNLPGTSAACRVGLTLLEAVLKGESMIQAIDSENVK